MAEEKFETGSNHQICFLSDYNAAQIVSFYRL